jgi:hypothetical protein
VRNAVLEVRSPDPKEEPIFVGLILVEDPKKPLEFSFAKELRCSHPLRNWDRRDHKPLGDRELLLASVKCELKSFPAEVGGDNKEYNFLWKDNVVLRLERKHDDVILVAEWKGRQKEAPILYVDSFVVYMKVGNHDVEVLRFGKSKRARP